MINMLRLCCSITLVLLYFSALTTSAITTTPTPFPTIFPTSAAPTSVYPTSLPSGQPTGLPTGNPSGWPTSQPSSWNYWFTTNLVELSTLSYSNAAATEPLVNQPLAININLIMSVVTNSSFEFIITLPRMYKPFINDYYDGYIPSSNLAVVPSNVYEVVWREGNFSTENPYADTAVSIRMRDDFVVPANKTISLSITVGNGIASYCDAIGSQEYYYSNWSTHTRDQIDVPHIAYRFLQQDMSFSELSMPRPITSFPGIGKGCSHLNNCSHHGVCNYCLKKCQCEEGFGARTDLVTTGRDVANTCATRVCPVGRAIGDLATAPNRAHAPAECSNRGKCNRQTGTCECYAPFGGRACNEMTCPTSIPGSECSGHGVCFTIAELASSDAISAPTVYGSTALARATVAWDHDIMKGCVCNSSWPVGYENNSYQLPEYFRPDCSQQRCPSGDNPYTCEDEEDCFGVSQTGGVLLGEYGNKCHVECSNRGFCNRNNGTCTCFEGSTGASCSELADGIERPACLPTGQPTSVPTNTFRPTGQPTSQPSSTPSSMPTGILLLQANITACDLIPNSVGKTTAAVNCTLFVDTFDAEALVYCGGFKPGMFPIKSEDVVRQQNSALSNYGSVEVHLENLIPSSNYDIFCTSVTKAGVHLEIAQIIRTRMVGIKTECCRSVGLVTAPQPVNEDSFTLSGVNIFVPALPDYELNVTILAYDYVTNEVQPNITFNPPYAAFLPTSLSDSISADIIVGSGTAGKYWLNISVAGNSSNIYVINYFSTHLLRVYNISETPPTPALESAVFANDGGLVLVTFDSDTDRAFLDSEFQCDSLLLFISNFLARCVWLNLNQLTISINDDLIPGFTVTVKPGLLRAACKPTASLPCANYTTASGSVIVQTAVDPVVPTVMVSGERLVSSCGNVTLDLSASYGNAGRDWFESPTFSIVTTTAAHPSGVLEFLQNSYIVSPPTPISYKLLEPGAKYTIRVTLCNFLSVCNSGTHFFSVSESSTLPLVNIPGPTERTIVARDSLVISTTSVVAICGEPIITHDMSYVWFVYEYNLEPSVDIPSESLADPSKYALSPYTFRPNTWYRLKVVGTYVPSGEYSEASIYVIIEPGAIIPAITGGEVLSIRANTTLLMDGYGTIDQGSRDISNLTFTWTCIQLIPVYRTVCPVVISPQNNGRELLVWAGLRVNSTQSRITLTVLDDSNQRRASTDTLLNSLPVQAPLIKPTNPASPIIRTQALILSAVINTELPCTARWSVNATEVGLATKSPGPISKPIVGGKLDTRVYLSVPPNLLSAGITYAFRITCGISTAVVITSVNQVPQYGTLVVSPFSGVELSTLFNFAADRWYDTDLPLSYEFGLYTNAGFELNIRAKTEVSFYNAQVLTSNSSANHDVRGYVHVYDIYAAMSNATYLFRVLPAPNAITPDVLLGELAASTGVNDEMIDAVVTVGSVLTAVTCDDAPNCGGLFRRSCDGSTQSHSCGLCAAGYIGDESLPTTPCIANTTVVAPAIFQTNPVTGTVEQVCTVDSDCGIYGVCGNNSCSTPSKSCLLDCSGNGICYFRHTSTGNGVDTCLQKDVTCTAYCVCNDGYAGGGCSLNITSFQASQGVMGELVNTLSTLTVSEFLTTEVVAARSQLIASAVKGSDLLVPQSANLLLDIVAITMSNGEQQQMSYTDLETLIDSASVLTTLLTNSILANKLGVDSRFFGGLRRLALSTTSEPTLVDIRKIVVTMLDTFLNVVTASMVPGQPNFEKIVGPFRLTATTFETTDTFYNASLAIPRTPFEKVVNTSTSSVQFGVPVVNGTVSATGSLSISESFSQGYDAEFTPMSGNPLRVIAQGVNFSQGLKFTLQNNNEEAYPYLQSNYTYTTECFLGVPSFHTYFCFDKFRLSPGYNITHTCIGYPGKFVSACPGQSFQPKCFPITGINVTEDYEMCEILEYSRWNSTCHCKVQGRYPNGTLAPLKENSNPNITLTYDSSYTVEIAPFKIFMPSPHYHEFFPYVRPRSYIIVSFVSTVWIAVLIVFGFGLSKYGKQKFVQALKKNFKLSSPVHKQHPALETLSSMEKEDSRDVQQDRAIWLFIDGMMPTVFLPNREWRKQLAVEVLENHRYSNLFRPLVTKEEYFKALRSLVHLLSIMLGIMMAILVVYNYQTPVDDNSCPLHTTREACLQRRTPFDGAITYCRWHISKEYKDTSFCYYQEPRLYWRSSLLVYMVVGIFISFYRAAVEYLLEIVCWVPITETEDDNDPEPLPVVVTSSAVSPTNNLLALLPSSSPSPMSPNNANNRFRIRQSLIDATTRSKDASAAGTPVTGGMRKKFNLKSVVKRVQLTVGMLNTMKFKTSAKIKQEEKRQEDGLVRDSVKITLDNQTDMWGSPTYFQPPPPLKKHWLELKALQLLAYIVDDRKMVQEEEDVVDAFNDLVHSIHVQLCTSMTNQTRKQFLFDWSVIEGREEGELPCRFVNDTIQAHVMRDIKYGARAALRAKKYFEHYAGRMPEGVMGTQILHLFMKDLLGRDSEAALIFYAKVAHQFKYMETNVLTKAGAAVLLLGLNICAAWVVLYIGSERTRQWQLMCLIGSILQFILEIFLAETVCCAVVHFAIPHLILKKVEQVLQVLHTTIKKMYDLEAGKNIEHADGHAELLDVPSFFYGTRSIAKQWPDLFESTVVLYFTSITPGVFGEKWQEHLPNTDPTFEGIVFFYYTKYKKYFDPVHYMKLLGGFPMTVQEIASHALFQGILCGAIILIFEVSYRMFFVRIVLPLFFGSIFMYSGGMTEYVVLPLYRVYRAVYRAMFSTAYPVGIDLPAEDESQNGSGSGTGDGEEDEWGSDDDDSWDSEDDDSEEEALEIEERELDLLFSLSNFQMTPEKRATMVARRASIAERRASVAEHRASRRASTIGGVGGINTGVGGTDGRRASRRMSSMRRGSSAGRRASTHRRRPSSAVLTEVERIIDDEEYNLVASELLGDDRVAVSSSESGDSISSEDSDHDSRESDPTSSYHSSEEAERDENSFWGTNTAEALDSDGEPDPDRVIDLVPKRDVIALDDYLDDSPVRVVANSASRVGKFGRSVAFRGGMEAALGALPDHSNANAPPVRLPPPSGEQFYQDDHFEAMLSLVDQDKSTKDVVFGPKRIPDLPTGGEGTVAGASVPGVTAGSIILPGTAARPVDYKPMSLQDEEKLEEHALDSMLGLFKGGGLDDDDDDREDADNVFRHTRRPLRGLRVPGQADNFMPKNSAQDSPLNVNRRLDLLSQNSSVLLPEVKVKAMKMVEKDSADALAKRLSEKKEKEKALLQERLWERKGLAPPLRQQQAVLPAIGSSTMSPAPPPRRDLQRLQSVNTVTRNLKKVEALKKTAEHSANKLKEDLSGKQEQVKANLQERLKQRSGKRHAENLVKVPVKEFDFDVSDDENHHKGIDHFHAEVSDGGEENDEDAHRHVPPFHVDVSDEEEAKVDNGGEEEGNEGEWGATKSSPFSPSPPATAKSSDTPSVRFTLRPPASKPPVGLSDFQHSTELDRELDQYRSSSSGGGGGDDHDHVALSDDDDDDLHRHGDNLGKDTSHQSLLSNRSFQHSEVSDDGDVDSDNDSDEMYNFDLPVRSPVPAKGADATINVNRSNGRPRVHAGAPGAVFNKPHDHIAHIALSDDEPEEDNNNGEEEDQSLGDMSFHSSHSDGKADKDDKDDDDLYNFDL